MKRFKIRIEIFDEIEEVWALKTTNPKGETGWAFENAVLLFPDPEEVIDIIDEEEADEKWAEEIMDTVHSFASKIKFKGE